MNNNICGHMITNEDVQTSIMKNTQIGVKIIVFYTWLYCLLTERQYENY